MMFLIGTVSVTAVALAQAAGADLPPWASWGVLGLIVVGFITKQIVPGYLYADAKEENKDLRAENARLVQTTLDVQKATLPALEASTSAISEHLREVRRRGEG